jgi:hypothetical protein
MGLKIGVEKKNCNLVPQAFENFPKGSNFDFPKSDLLEISNSATATRLRKRFLNIHIHTTISRGQQNDFVILVIFLRNFQKPQIYFY